MTDRAIEYAKEVVNGEIIAGKLIIKAAQRFLDELNKQSTDGFPYYYSSEHAERVTKFIELLPQTNGQPLGLEPFENFIINNIYGWRKDSDGSLRFNRVLISEARKNGKSFLMAVLGSVALLMEKQPARGRQILYTANSSQQAHLAFDMLADQLSAVRAKSDSMRKRLKIGKQKIEDRASNSYATALATDHHTTDGYNPLLAIVDEYHQARDSTMLDALKSGMVQQDNGILAIISTAGFDLQSPFKQELDYVEDLLEGKIQNDRYFAAVYALDDPSEVEKPEMWIKANPLMSNPKMADKMKTNIANDIQIAKQQDSMYNVLVKNMNLFVQQSNDSFISVQDWDHGRITEAPDIREKTAYAGIDLSKVGDLTAVSWLIPVGNGKFYVDSHAFVGTYGGISKKSATDGVDYEKMARNGWCSISGLESGTIDYDEVFQYVIDYVEQNHLRLKFLCYDPARWGSSSTRFEKWGIDTVEVHQGGSSLGIPIRTLKEEILKGNILHAKNDLLDFHVANAIVRYDKWGNPLFDKKSNHKKIDMLAALVTGYKLAMNYYEEEEQLKDWDDYYQNEFSF